MRLAFRLSRSPARQGLSVDVGRSVVEAALLGALMATPQARADDSAEWVRTGPGQWSNAFNWLCSFNNGPNTPCVPGAGFGVSLFNGADVDLDLAESVSQVAGDASTRLTLDPGKTLSATGLVGVVVGDLILNQGSTLTSTNVGADALIADGATITASGSIGASEQTDIRNSRLSSLSAVGEIFISGSVINNLASAPSFSSLAAIEANIPRQGRTRSWLQRCTQQSWSTTV